MDILTFCRQSRVLVVAGKGGVGKTTIAAALASMAAQAGLRVLLVELEGRSGLPSAFGRSDPLGYDTELYLSDASGGEVRARRLTPDDALIEYLVEHGMRRISKRLASSGTIDVVSTAIPGIRDILVLGKIKQIERAGAADLILVDAPATGHAMTFLTSASGLLDAARSGPVRSQATEVVEMLSDPSRCQVMLVTLPEEMPMNEVVEAAYALEDRVGVSLGPVVINGVLEPPAHGDMDPGDLARAEKVPLEPDVAEAAREASAFRSHRRSLQLEQLSRLADALPLAQLVTPFLDSDTIGPDELRQLSAALQSGIAALALPSPADQGSRGGRGGSGGSPTRPEAAGAS
jgi:anion-transporting  ArsA/GET3 family ATPase